MDKRGQELSTSTIILIILGLIILVVLILGFMLGWNKILPILKSDSNVNDISMACQQACTLGSDFDFCNRNFALKDGKNEFTDTCKNFATKTEYSKYSIADCPGIVC